MNQRASALPPRSRGESSDKTPEQVVAEAPLMTNPVEQVIQQDLVKEWRKSTNMSEEELMYLTEKASFNIPIELMLRLSFILDKKKARALGQKSNKTALVVDALDQYTKRELKKLGHPVE